MADVLNGLFGRVISYVYVIEFQKRGLPHAHMLFVLDPRDKLNNADKIDKFIKAEIPENNPELKDLVLKHMLHGPHTDKLLCYNSETKKCTKHFPKPFTEETCYQHNGFPEYRRSDNSDKQNYYNKLIDGKRIKVDNSMVVPYNPQLLKNIIVTLM